jgi:hypothetical protein
MTDAHTERGIAAIAKDRADWLVDAVACATQDRRFLRGDPKEDRDLVDVLFLNAEKAILDAILKATTPNAGERG